MAREAELVLFAGAQIAVERLHAVADRSADQVEERDETVKAREGDGGRALEELEERQSNARQCGHDDLSLLQQSDPDVGPRQQLFQVFLRDVLEQLEDNGPRIERIGLSRAAAQAKNDGQAAIHRD